MSVNDLIAEGMSLFKSNNFDEAIVKFNQAWSEIKDKNSQLEEQTKIHLGLGRCYFEQALKVKDITEAKDLFAQAVKYHQEQLKLAEQLTNEQTRIQEQINAQFFLGRCYLEQAMKVKDIAEAKDLFAQAVKYHQKELKLAEQLTDEQTGIQQQINAQSWLGRCYLEQAMKVKDITEAKGLFAQAVEHNQERLKLVEQLTDERTGIQQQIYAQAGLGYCYLKQAIRTKDITEAKDLFAQAVKYHQEQLKLVEQLTDEQTGIQQQIYAQAGLGYCYLKQAIRTKDITEAKDLFAQAVKYHQKELKLAEQLTDEQTGIQQQINAQFWLGRCYLAQAMKVKDIREAKDLFAQAVKYRQEQLYLAEQLIDEQTRIQEQINAQSWLGGCYFEQAMRAKGISEAKGLFLQAIEYFRKQLELAEQLTDKQISIQKQISVRSCLGGCYFEQAMRAKDISEAKGLFLQAIEYFREQLKLAEQLADKQISIQKQINAQSRIKRCSRNIDFLETNWEGYFNKKKQEIHEFLFSNENNSLDEQLKETISTVLAVLHIPPIELGSTPLAHYTSSIVCNKLFGVVNEDDSSPMRIGSSSYMNDPSEGKGLLELLSLQDLELENKTGCSPYNAFFACFSSRVNDLNQFRLYGKEDGVEASGACLVFNKYGNWLKEPDILAPFRSFIKNQGDNLVEFKETNISNVEYEKLPLYQVAYIAYKDEYIAKEKCEIWLDNFKFGICLKSVDKNNEWHKYRIKKLKEALQQLIKFFKKKANVNDENKNALEYIRYLFKDFAFRDEEEFRVLKIAEIGSEEIEYCKTTKSIYLPYADISNVVDEVILGTNYEKTNSRHKAEVFQHHMKQKCPYVKVSRSSLPIYANPPIKKD